MEVLEVDKIAARQPQAVRDYFFALYRDKGEMTPARIHRTIERRFGEGTVTDRSVREWCRIMEQVDTSAPWRLEPDSPPEAAYVLDVLAEMAFRSEGRVTTVSTSLAHWIMTLARVRPSLVLRDLYRLAWMYNVRTLTKAGTDDLDGWLAFKAWESDEHDELYAGAVQLGWIPAAPPHLVRPLTRGLERDGIDEHKLLDIIAALADGDDEEEGDDGTQ
jgi:hypothetical protein